MKFEQAFKLAKCAMAVEYHILESAIPLSCGHHICKNCIPQDFKLKCQTCGEINQYDLNVSKESEVIKFIIEQSLPNFSEYLDKIYEEEANCQIETSEAQVELFSKRIDFVKEEIEVRIESLKAVLDTAKNELFVQLKSLKHQMEDIPIKQCSKRRKLFHSKLSKDVTNIKELYSKQEEVSKIRKSKIKQNVFLDFKIPDFKILPSNIIQYKCNELISSKILEFFDIPEFYNLCGFQNNPIAELIYRGSEHGFHVEKLHEKCDGASNTITLIKSAHGCIFGCYTKLTWKSNDILERDRSAFLFSFKNVINTPKKLNFISDRILGYSTDRLLSIGCSDINISNHCNLNSNSFVAFNLLERIDSEHFLVGMRSFVVNEIEIYRLIEE